MWNGIPIKKNHVRQHNTSFQCRCYASRDHSLSKPFNRRKKCKKMCFKNIMLILCQPKQLILKSHVVTYTFEMRIDGITTVLPGIPLSGINIPSFNQIPL